MDLRLSGAERAEEYRPRSLALPRAQQTSLLRSVAVLERLHASWRLVRAENRQLALALCEARAALAVSRAALAEARVGEQHARQLALHDSLTSLPNRSHFRARLQRVLAELRATHGTLAVVYMDLDRFKQVNDEHGHDAGDQLLRIIAARLAQTVRAGDMVSRLGGDEFACLLTNLPNRGQLNHLAEKLFDAVSAPVSMGRLQLTVRPSIGIAVGPADGDTADTLLKHADQAMYRAKRHRYSHVYFDARCEA